MPGDVAVLPTWSLTLLGAWRLTDVDATLHVGLNVQRLFAVLALRGRCERTYLSGLLWPDCSEPHAHGNLRATLSRLHRHWSTTPLEAQDGILALRPDVDVDVHRLVRAASAVLDGRPPRLDRRMVDHLAGDDLLLGWYEDWVLLERERLRQLRLHALEALSGQLLAAGDPAAAVEAALAAVSVEPIRESAHRAAIRAHLAEGNRGEAVRQFDRLRGLLRVELGVEPSSLAADLLR